MLEDTLQACRTGVYYLVNGCEGRVLVFPAGHVHASVGSAEAQRELCHAVWQARSCEIAAVLPRRTASGRI